MQNPNQDTNQDTNQDSSQYIREQLAVSMKRAMIEKQTLKLSVIRMINSKIKNADIAARLKKPSKKIDKKPTSRLSAYGNVTNSVGTKQTPKPAQNNDIKISKPEIVSLLQNMIKQRSQSAQMYKSANRHELAAQELMEIDIIKSFMPAQLSFEQIAKIVNDTSLKLNANSPSHMGRVMADIKANYSGQLDMATASKLLKDILVNN